LKRLLKTAMLIALTSISIACSAPQKTYHEYRWAYCDVIPTDLANPWACLRKEDVVELKKELHECRKHVGRK